MKAGDLVEYEGKDYLAIKVNQKSAYICENMNFLSMWQNKPKGMTWKELCQREDAIKVSPDNLKLKKESVVEVKEKKAKKGKISSFAHKQLKESFLRYCKRDKGSKSKAHAFLIESSGERISPVMFNKEKNLVLFHNTTSHSFHFYDIETGDVQDFIEEKNKDGKKVIWP